MKNLLVSCMLFAFGLAAYAAEDVKIIPLSLKYQPCPEGSPQGCKFASSGGRNCKLSGLSMVRLRTTSQPPGTTTLQSNKPYGELK